jgi:hypothetical protein
MSSRKAASYWLHAHGRGRHLSGWAGEQLTELLTALEPRSRDRLKSSSWRHFWIDLAHAPAAPADVQLEPLTQSLIERLRQHPECRANQLISGFRFWDLGLRRGFVWLWQGEPLCIEWLLLAQDNERLQALPGWAGIHLPLAPGEGRLENLFKFHHRNPPPRDIALHFQHGLFAEARRLGVRQLYSHVHVDNKSATALALRSGRQQIGWIRRYELDLPALRGKPFFLHQLEDRFEPPAPIIRARWWPRAGISRVRASFSGRR